VPRKHSKSSIALSANTSHRGHKYYKRNLTWLWVSLGALLVAFVGFLFFSPRPTPSVEITPVEAYEKYQQGAFFLDVRSQEEWNQVHIRNSTLIPVDELPNRLTELPRDKDIVVVCLSGHRSQNGAAILQQAGFKRISCLDGGLQAWMDANYPVEKGTP
jgi:rhodanese-related sulfurtransferase